MQPATRSVSQKQQAKENPHQLVAQLLSMHSMHSTAFKIECCLCNTTCAWMRRLQQGVVIQKQQAKEKLHKLVAPLLSMHSADQLSLSALGAIQPKLNLSFSEVGATLRDGSIILQGVTGHFNRGQVDFI